MAYYWLELVNNDKIRLILIVVNIIDCDSSLVMKSTGKGHKNNWLISSAPLPTGSFKTDHHKTVEDS